MQSYKPKLSLRGQLVRPWQSVIVLLTFLVNSFGPIPVYAQDFSIDQLPVPGAMVGESASFSPIALKGLMSEDITQEQLHEFIPKAINKSGQGELK